MILQHEYRRRVYFVWRRTGNPHVKAYVGSVVDVSPIEAARQARRIFGDSPTQYEVKEYRSSRSIVIS